jgi:hypothetical protein
MAEWLFGSDECTYYRDCSCLNDLKAAEGLGAYVVTNVCRVLLLHRLRIKLWRVWQIRI